jgi:hypothetical protein
MIATSMAPGPDLTFSSLYKREERNFERLRSNHQIHGRKRNLNSHKIFLSDSYLDFTSNSPVVRGSAP